VFPDQNVWDAGVNASWDLDVFGGIRHTVQARGALADVAEASLRDVQVAMTAEVARAYFELRGAQEQLEVARRNAENQRHTFELTQERLAAGRGSAFDTERAQAQLSSTLASIPAREAQVAGPQPGTGEGGGGRGAGTGGRRPRAVRSRRPRRDGGHRDEPRPVSRGPAPGGTAPGGECRERARGRAGAPPVP